MLAMKVDTSLIGLYTGIGGRTTKLRLTRGCCCQLISRMHFQQCLNSNVNKNQLKQMLYNPVLGDNLFKSETFTKNLEKHY
mgnify:CR=1 FL=1